MSVCIVAEMSANHLGSKERAKEIILAARECGADAVKLQTYTADTLTLNHDSDLFRTRQGTLWAGRTMYDLYQEAAMPWEWHAELKSYADEVGIELFSSPFDYTAVDFLLSLGISRFKIASPEAMDYPLVSYAAKFNKPMIISTGMSSLEEITEVIDACLSVGNRDITLLKCTSEYPATIESSNLATIPDLIGRFGHLGVRVGLSDHSMCLEPPVVAVALGASMIEKHLTLNRSDGGVDSGFSLNVEEFRQMVAAVRAAEKTIGDITYCSAEHRAPGARSLFVVSDIQAGECFTPDNLRSIRPSNGLHPKYYADVIGKKAICSITRGTPLSFAHVDLESS